MWACWNHTESRSSDRVVLSYHICNTVSIEMEDMFDNEEDGEMRGTHV